MPGSHTAQTTRSDFDIVAHHRARTRRAEARADALEHVRRRLERLLAIALRAAAGNDCDPVVLLTVIERIDEESQRPGADYEELALLLRDAKSSIEEQKQEVAA